MQFFHYISADKASHYSADCRSQHNGRDDDVVHVVITR